MSISSIKIIMQIGAVIIAAGAGLVIFFLGDSFTFLQLKHLQALLCFVVFMGWFSIFDLYMARKLHLRSWFSESDERFSSAIKLIVVAVLFVFLYRRIDINSFSGQITFSLLVCATTGAFFDVLRKTRVSV